MTDKTDSPQPVAEVVNGRLRWAIPYPTYELAQKYMHDGTHPLYDADQLSAAVAAERERCAAIVDVPDNTPSWEVIGGRDTIDLLQELADKIREGKQ